jgi:ribosomal protein S26
MKMGRGREPLVRCDACGRRIPRDKSVEYIKGMSFDTGEQKDVVIDLTARKVHYCISCAKHRGIFEKKKERAEQIRKRREGVV